MFEVLTTLMVAGVIAIPILMTGLWCSKHIETRIASGLSVIIIILGGVCYILWLLLLTSS